MHAHTHTATPTTDTHTDEKNQLASTSLSVVDMSFIPSNGKYDDVVILFHDTTSNWNHTEQ